MATYAERKARWFLVDLGLQIEDRAADTDDPAAAALLAAARAALDGVLNPAPRTLGEIMVQVKAGMVGAS